MGSVQLPDMASIFDLGENPRDRAQRRFERTKGKVRKAGFDSDEIGRNRMIAMNRENFAKIAQAQLTTRVISLPSGRALDELPLLKSFKDELTLGSRVEAALEHYELNEPTPIQMVAIPYIKHYECDMVIKAQTGSGKTNAYLLPIIDYVMSVKDSKSYTPNATSPYAIIVAPTHELTIQLACDATRLLRNVHHIKVAFGFGGLNATDSKKILLNGCDLLFVTAGRLLDYFNPRHGRQASLDTKNVKFIVLDEADSLLKSSTNRKAAYEEEDEKDEKKNPDEILHDFIIKRLTHGEHRTNFRVLLLSATLKAADFELFVVPDNTITISVGDGHVVPTVKQSFVHIKHECEKLQMLMDTIDLIASHYPNPKEQSSERPRNAIGKTIIFINNKRQGDRLAHSLITKGFCANSINSDRSSRQRVEAMRDLMDGVIDILVSTDVLSRGLNIPRVDYIINYDHPHYFNSDEYIHRVGRCGRLGNVGTAITFFDPTKDYASAGNLINGLLAVGERDIPHFLTESRLYAANRYHRVKLGAQHQASPRYVFRQNANISPNNDAGYDSPGRNNRYH